jgi:hypothetical protein
MGLGLFDQTKLHASVANPAVSDETIAQFEYWFQKQNIGQDYTTSSFERLKDLLGTETQQLHQELSGPLNLKDDHKWLKKKLAFSQELVEAFAKEQTEQQKQQLFYRAKTIIYMLHAEEALDKAETKRASIQRFDPKVILRTIRAFMSRKSMMTVDIPHSLTGPVSSYQLNKEARFLNQSIIPVNILEVAASDVPDDHPLFRPLNSYQPQDYLWPAFEKAIEEQTTLLLKKKFPIFQEQPFRLKEANRLVFFDGIKNSQTSAKINTKDVFGHTWKLKWSDEIHAEAIANRLYYNLGTTYVDQVYLPPLGRKGTIMVLSDPKENTDNKIAKDCFPQNQKEFVDCLLKSRFHYNMKPFIDEEGYLSEDNIESFLLSLPLIVRASVKKEQLIGRYFITFKEVLAEFKPQEKLVTPGGPYSFTRFGAEYDRGVRGLLLFNSWINGGDTKEANNKGYLISPKLLPFSKGDAPVFVAAQHDMGKSLAGILESGNPNNLKENDFIFQKKGEIRFDYLLLDTPRAWHKTTYADLLWMAQRIIPLTKSVFEQMVAETQWPDFQQQAMVYKLQKRRNRLAEIFHLEHLLPANEQKILAPSMKLSVKDPLTRSLLAIRYGLKPEQLEDVYQQYNGPGLKEDHILKEGRIQSCQNSPLIRALHVHRHPMGLDRRRTRYAFINNLRPDQKPCGGILDTELFH